MLANSGVFATIPAQDLERAKSFYGDKLDLEPVEEGPEGSASCAETADSSCSSRPEPLPARTRNWRGMSMIFRRR
jgi:catechol 2,3-dioxygenase-like lactoylglutathione lyase family enzyme